MERPCYTTHECSVCSAGLEQLSTAKHCCGTLKRCKGFTVPIKIPVDSLKALMFATVSFNLYSLDAFRRLIRHFYCDASKEAQSSSTQQAQVYLKQ